MYMYVGMYIRQKCRTVCGLHCVECRSVYITLSMSTCRYVGKSVRQSADCVV